MSSEDPIPDIHELKEMLDTLCGHLRNVRKEMPAGELADELELYLTSLETSSKEMIPAYEADLAEETAVEERKRQTEVPPVKAPPAAPVEEDVLALGLTLRTQILEHFKIQTEEPAWDLQGEGSVARAWPVDESSAEPLPPPLPPPKSRQPPPPAPVKKPTEEKKPAHEQDIWEGLSREE